MGGLIENGFLYIKDLMKSLDYIKVKFVYNPKLSSPELFFVLTMPEGFKHLMELYNYKKHKKFDWYSDSIGIKNMEDYINKEASKYEVRSHVVFTALVNSFFFERLPNDFEIYYDIFKSLNINGQFATIGIYQKDNNPKKASIKLTHEYMHTADYFLGKKYSMNDYDLEYHIYEVLTDLRTLFVTPKKYLNIYKGHNIGLEKKDYICLKDEFKGSLRERIKKFSERFKNDSKIRDMFMKNSDILKYKEKDDEKIDETVRICEELSESYDKNLLFFN